MRPNADDGYCPTKLKQSTGLVRSGDENACLGNHLLHTHTQQQRQWRRKKTLCIKVRIVYPVDKMVLTQSSSAQQTLGRTIERGIMTSEVIMNSHLTYKNYSTINSKRRTVWWKNRTNADQCSLCRHDGADKGWTLMEFSTQPPSTHDPFKGWFSGFTRIFDTTTLDTRPFREAIFGIHANFLYTTSTHDPFEGWFSRFIGTNRSLLLLRWNWHFMTSTERLTTLGEVYFWGRWSCLLFH